MDYLGGRVMARALLVAISLIAYAIGFAGMLAFMAFAGGWRVGPWWIDAPARTAISWAIAVNFGLVTLFGLQHSVMARPGFKGWWTRFVPSPIERSVYCVATAAALCVLCAGWQPLPGVVWSTENAALRALLTGLQLLGWATVISSSFMINHLELFGVQQALDHAAGRHATDQPMATCWLYRFVRHPIQAGILLGVWATPHMGTSHMFFSALLSAYIFIGLYFEERDLTMTLGQAYVRYRQHVPMLIPLGRWRSNDFRSENQPLVESNG